MKLKKNKLEFSDTSNKILEIGKKIKLNFKNLEYISINLGGGEVVIKPYLSEQDIIVAIQLCQNQFFDNIDTESDIDKFGTFSFVKSMFDLVVFQNCTNIDINGVKTEYLISSGIAYEIRKYIYNYNEVWDLILKSIELKNVNTALGLIAETIPTGKEMTQSIEEISGIISDLNKNDPKTLMKLAELTAIKTSIEEERIKISNERKSKTKEKLNIKKKDLDVILNRE